VAGKLHNQEKLLRYFGKSRTGESGERLAVAAERLRSLRREVLGLEGDDPERVRGSAMGLEGAGGREYWGALAETLRPELGFVRRVHEQPEDGVNASLNYGYGILYSHVWGAVMNAGLEPFAGFLHGERAGKPSMVLDMIEEFRQPVVDRPLMAWFFKGGTPRMERGLLDEGTREEVATRVLTRLNTAEPHRGKSHQVRSIIQMQARLAASAVRGLKKYRPFAFKW
jgi:CRISPR-associated protein Cas1